MFPLRYNTAGQEVPLGYFLDSADGDTEETGLTIANTDIKLHKSGATSLANKNSGGATHMSNGIYYAVLDATDTNTLGPMVIFVHVSGALTVRLECIVYPAAVYDGLYGSGIAELTGVPSATPDFGTALMTLFMPTRNKLISDDNTGEVQIHKDDGTKIIEQPYTDSGGIFTRNKMETPD
jgi:hypothetical protein